MTDRDDGVLSPVGLIELRDWFAGQALVGITAAAASDEYSNAVCKRAEEAREAPEEYCARMAYALADAMLEARKR